MDWIEHLKKQHKEHMDVCGLGFKDYKSFLAWKEEEEFMSESQYIQKCSSQLLGHSKTWYFILIELAVIQPEGNIYAS